MDGRRFAIHEAEHGGLRLQVDLQPRANYALALSGIPFVRAVVVHNETEIPLSSIRVSGNLDIVGYPEPIAWSREIPGLHAAGSVVRLDRSADFQEFLPVLAAAGESAPGRLDLRATSPSLPGIETHVVADLEVSSFNEFLNSPGLQSSLATFVQPNTRSITEILRDASRWLMEQTGDGALAGYQSDLDRVHAIAAAIYEAIRVRSITYINPPASFERTGQKVRTTEQVLIDRFGTCIDLSVMYAACLEAAGLYPTIFLMRRHAFAGYYSREIFGETTVVTEHNSVANLVELGILTPVELTGLNPGTDVGFARARATGVAALTADLDEFAALIDVRRARLEDIRPMPHFHTANDPIVEQRELDEARPFVVRADIPASETGIDERVQGVLEARDDAPTRFRIWKRELLDLSLRNPLLNLPRTQKVIDLVIPGGMLSRLDDVVHMGKQIRLLPADKIDVIHLARGATSAMDLTNEELESAFALSRQVYTTLIGEAWQRQLRTIKREAEILEQETGSNYLFLTLGALVHPKKGGGEARAPLFLLPVRVVGGVGSRGFAIVLDGQEIAQPNLCLLQWLKTIHGIDLPTLVEPAIDEFGIAIQTVLDAVRQALVDARLPVRIDETSTIAILKFATFQIWKDLDEHWETLIGNPVVRHLVERPGETFQDPAGDDIPAIDETNLRLPIAADGSQMTAIMRAAEGQSFVLEGPPGTGKSQTITNLIAHALVEGKTVLFVAEKQAALEVVQRRLDAIGIGALALELHGSKQSMASIRGKLRRALELDATVDESAWESADGALRAAITRLKSHAGRVHDKNAVDHSLWTAYDAFAAVGPGPIAEVPQQLVAPGCEQAVDRESAMASAQEFQVMAIQAGLRPGYPWLIVGACESDAFDIASLIATVRDLGAARARLASLSLPWRRRLRQFAPDGSLAALVHLLDAGAANLTPAVSAVSAIDRLSWTESVDALRASLIGYRTQFQEILDTVRPASLMMPELEELVARAVAGDGIRLFREMRLRGLIADVQAHLNQSCRVDSGGLTALLTTWRDAQRAAVELGSVAAEIDGLTLPGEWRPGSPDAVTMLDRSVYISRLFVWIHASDPQLACMISQTGDADRSILRDIDDTWQRWLTALGASKIEIERWAPPKGSVARDWVTAWESDEVQWANDLATSGALRPQRARELARAARQFATIGLESFATNVLSGAIPPDQIAASMARGLAAASVAERLANGELDRFDADAQDRAVSTFLREGQRLRELQATRLAATMVARRPFRTDRLRGEVAELKRQLDRKRGGLSFRDLMNRYSDTILALTPCFLMSPGSVAHFLAPEAVTFDLVIFDEASQIRVPQAIGSMGRGKAVVVVGDSRQMPPTRIMEVEVGSNDDLATTEQVVVEDLESILSEAVESGLPREWLTWHYRSQDESLIAFSNERYYDDRLVSLPSPGADASTGLSWRRLDGEFDRGRTRTNEIEASAVVDEIVARLHDPATRDDSIGVVCFNIQQRDLILNKLEESDDPQVRKALAAEPGVALFVKNLENVQGDERDVILFSLAFSTDRHTGKLPLNFGPLNLAGGERRLNVAVTRARKQVVIFSSFDPGDIELNRTGSRGLRDLRRYLEFASRRPDVGEDDQDNGSAARGRLMQELATALTDRGYEVGTEIGLSTFKVDLAVRKPDESRWRVAVMVDSPGWASRPTVADRDGATALLTGIMHWPAVVRVWLPGWLRDNQGTIDRICAAVDGTPDIPISPASQPAHASPTGLQQPQPPITSPARPLPTESMTTLLEPGVFIPTGDAAIADRTVLDRIELAAPAIYRYATEITAVEGPVRLERLGTLIARRFGVRRLTSQKRGEIEVVIRENMRITEVGAEFVWPPNLDPETWTEFRRNASSEDRALDEISPWELVNAMCWLLTSAISMGRAELEREVLTFFGYLRLTESARSWLAESIEFGLASGRILEDDRRYRTA